MYIMLSTFHVFSPFYFSTFNVYAKLWVLSNPTDTHFQKLLLFMDFEYSICGLYFEDTTALGLYKSDFRLRTQYGIALKEQSGLEDSLSESSLLNEI